MRCPRCQQEQAEDRTDCRHCGVIFSQYRPRPARPPVAERPPWARLGARMFEIEPAGNPPLLLGRLLLWLVLLVWGIHLLRLPSQGPALGESFLHMINLPFHEAGHFVFRPFGSFLHVLGGTLGQLLVPLLVAVALLQEDDPFGAAAGIWWLGESFMDCAPYIHDARDRVLMLLSGETGQDDWEGHDWYQLLSRLGWLKYDHSIARMAWGLGAGLLLAGLVWAGYVLWRQSLKAPPEAG